MTDNQSNQSDLKTAYRELDVKLDLEAQPESALRPELLLGFPFEYAGRQTRVMVETEEFTALCPWTGLPDLGTLTIEYQPDQVCLELKSLKYYLMHFRSVGMVQEHAAHRILADLVAAIRPVHMRVTLDYRLRGGLHTVVEVNHPAPSPPSG